VIVFLTKVIQRCSEESKLLMVQALNALLFALVEGQDEIVCGRVSQNSLDIAFDPSFGPLTNLSKLRLVKVVIQDDILVVEVVKDVVQEHRTLVPEVDGIEVFVKVIPTVGLLGNVADWAWELLAKCCCFATNLAVDIGSDAGWRRRSWKLTLR
jgi:hypothetical protein